MKRGSALRGRCLAIVATRRRGPPPHRRRRRTAPQAATRAVADPAHAQRQARPDGSLGWRRRRRWRRPRSRRTRAGEVRRRVPVAPLRAEPGRCGDYTNQSEDGEFTARLNLNRPIYKPEHWDKVQQLDMWTNKYDPLFFCQPLGLPRSGRRLASSRPPATSCSCTRRAAAARVTPDTALSRPTAGSTTR